MPTFLEAEREATQALEPGESLVWTGKPIPMRACLAGHVPVSFLLGLFFAVFSILWAGHAVGYLLHPPPAKSGVPVGVILATLFDVPFLLVGLALLYLPFGAYRLATHTVYAVTSRRLLIMSGLRSLNVRSISSEALATIVRRERPDGSGDLIFNLDRTPAPTRCPNVVGRNTPAGFFGIANVREAEAAIRKAFPQIAI